ncbi:MAG: hypothetical protein KAS92_05520, partial [Candidatus Omnitrophica bacterium]|nr:hypothetical protein [Candidatus Omnitrophota bacterium]
RRSFGFPLYKGIMEIGLDKDTPVNSPVAIVKEGLLHLSKDLPDDFTKEYRKIAILVQFVHELRHLALDPKADYKTHKEREAEFTILDGALTWVLLATHEKMSAYVSVLRKKATVTSGDYLDQLEQELLAIRLYPTLSKGQKWKKGIVPGEVREMLKQAASSRVEIKDGTVGYDTRARLLEILDFMGFVSSHEFISDDTAVMVRRPSFWPVVEKIIKQYPGFSEEIMALEKKNIFIVWHFPQGRFLRNRRLSFINNDFGLLPIVLSTSTVAGVVSRKLSDAAAHHLRLWRNWAFGHRPLGWTHSNVAWSASVLIPNAGNGELSVQDGRPFVSSSPVQFKLLFSKGNKAKMANVGMMALTVGGVFLLNRMLVMDSAIEEWNSIRISMFYGAFITSVALRMPLAILYFIFSFSTAMIFPQVAEAGTFMRNHGYNLFFDVPQLALVLAWGYEVYLVLKHDDDSYNKKIERKPLRFGHSLKRIAIFSGTAAGLMIAVEILSPLLQYLHSLTKVLDSPDFAARKLTFDVLDVLAFTGGAVISAALLNAYYFLVYTPVAFVAGKTWAVLVPVLKARFPELLETLQDHNARDPDDDRHSSSPVSQSNRRSFGFPLYNGIMETSLDKDTPVNSPVAIVKEGLLLREFVRIILTLPEIKDKAEEIRRVTLTNFRVSNGFICWLLRLRNMVDGWIEQCGTAVSKVPDVKVVEENSGGTTDLSKKSSSPVGAVVVSSSSPVKDLNDPVWQAYYASKLKDEVYVRTNRDKLVGMVAALDDVSVLKDAAWQPIVAAVKGGSLSEKREDGREKTEEAKGVSPILVSSPVKRAYTEEELKKISRKVIVRLYDKWGIDYRAFVDRGGDLVGKQGHGDFRIIDDFVRFLGERLGMPISGAHVSRYTKLIDIFFAELEAYASALPDVKSVEKKGKSSSPVRHDSKLPLGRRRAVFEWFNNFNPVATGNNADGNGGGAKGHSAGQSGSGGNMLRFARSMGVSKEDVRRVLVVITDILRGYQQEALNAIIRYLHTLSDLIQRYVASRTAAKETAKDHIPAQSIEVYNLFILSWLGALCADGKTPGSIRVPSSQGSGVRGQGSDKTVMLHQLIKEITAEKTGKLYPKLGTDPIFNRVNRDLSLIKLKINRLLLLIHPWLVESGILIAAYSMSPLRGLDLPWQVGKEIIISNNPAAASSSSSPVDGKLGTDPSPKDLSASLCGGKYENIIGRLKESVQLLSSGAEKIFVKEYLPYLQEHAPPQNLKILIKKILASSELTCLHPSAQEALNALEEKQSPPNSRKNTARTNLPLLFILTASASLTVAVLFGAKTALAQGVGKAAFLASSIPIVLVSIVVLTALGFAVKKIRQFSSRQGSLKIFVKKIAVHHKFKEDRKLTLLEVFCVAAGAMISSGIFILPAVMFAIVGPAMILSYLCASLLVVAALYSMA